MKPPGLKPGSKIWEHATETVLLLEVCALAAMAVLPGTHTPLWTVPSIEGFAGLVVGFVIWSMTGSARFSWTAVFMGLYLAGWSTWASGGWLRPGVLVAWLIGTIAFIPLTALAAAHARDNQEPEAPPKPDPDAEKLAEMEKFEFMFTELGFEGVQVLDLTVELAGRMIRLALPRSGKVTIDDLQTAAKRIEVILRMKPGTIEFGHDGHAAEVTMRLRERDFLASTIPFSSQYRASTINKPFAIGIQEDGAVASITLRGLHARIIGVTDAGKSNLINVILAQLGGMVDTVIWVIDMKGGRVAKPWLRPYADGKASTPPIDWVATTREEAALMMSCFVMAVEARANSGIGGSKIIPSASLPQIILVTDEMADLFGVTKGTRKEVGDGATTNSEFIRMGETITQKGRSEACASVWASQRGTNTMAGSGDMKANTKLEIILGVAKRSEAMFVNADNRTAQKRAAAMVNTPGAGTITMGATGSLATKFFYLDHPAKPGGEKDETLCEDGCVPQCPIYRIATENASVRPRLDRLTATAMGEDYERRWERAAGVLRRPVPAGGAGRRLDLLGDPGRFDEVIAQSGYEDPEAKLTEGQRAALDILTARGVMGATPSAMLSELAKTGKPPARETLHRWLRMFEEQGLAHNCSFGRWKIGPDPKRAAA